MGIDKEYMWMSYRYCIGRHTITSHMQANLIAKDFYKELSDDELEFTAYDINREIEDQLRFHYPMFNFPLMGNNKIYTTALDCFFMFLDKFNIRTKNELEKIKRVDVEYNSDGTPLFSITRYEDVNEYTHDEVLTEISDRLSQYNKDISEQDKRDIIYRISDTCKKINLFKSMDADTLLSSVNDLMVWNDLVHLFNKSEHQILKLKDGTECECFQTWTKDYTKDENGNYNGFSYKKITVPVNEWNGITTVYIPEESIIK